MQDFYFLTNNLFTSYTLQEEFPKLYDFKQDLTPIFSKIQALYDTAKFTSQNEHQFEDDFISEVLEILGWHTIRQEEKIIQGKLEKPDFLLFSSKEAKKSYEKFPKSSRPSSNSFINVILESKAYDVAIDNKKVKDNPHFQILRYLNNLKLDFGFLTNGWAWRFYDNSKLSSQKIFYEINLEAILQRGDIEAFKYFYFIFNAQNFISTPQAQEPIQTLFAQNTTAKTKIEDDLKSLIYGINGKDSIFEKIGSCIYAKNPTLPLDEVYQDSIYFIFRLLFIAYFEDKFSPLLQKHSYYNDHISIQNLLTIAQNNPDKHDALVKLNWIFSIFDKGEPNYDMPIFNGGLFDTTRSKALNTPKLFSNLDLYEILHSLFFITLEGKEYRRDYKTLSITHLGTIYEGLLSYFFEVAQEDTYYLLYSEGKSKNIEGYFDAYDYALLSKKHKISKCTFYPKGELYLKNTSNSRKSTASFYTPTSLTSYLATHALKITDQNILDYKILDNACGSGHFLIQALNTITEHIITHFEDFPSFKALYEKEAQSIKDNTSAYITDYEVDEGDIIKRLLLKRMIYGIDLNPFSVELTKLSLWIDSFIFGTPLSFIEHHIKCGNALVGSSIKEFKSFYEKQTSQNLFFYDFMEHFNSLTEVFSTLNSLKDTTEEEIKTSKALYSQEITPKLSTLSLALDFLTAQDFFTPEDRARFQGKELDFIQSILTPNQEFHNLKPIIESLSKKYRFFHYEIAFPEVFSGEKRGFDCIIGNPPWDKIKIGDDDFFPQFISDYRTKKASEKKSLKLDLLSKPHIAKLYEESKAHIEALKIYYKSHYPLNYGIGDFNLFRLFVERNLSLLSPHSSLNYVLPSALMYEEGSLDLRKHILEEKTLTYFYSFENREGIFPDVDSRYKFALMQILSYPPASNHMIQTMSYLTQIDSLYTQEPITFTFQEISTLSPSQLALPEVRNQEMLNLLLKSHQAFPPLSLEWLDFRRELHMTDDKDLFIESSQEGLLPLYEGKMIHQNDCEFAPSTYFLNPQDFDKRLSSKELYRLKQDLEMSEKDFMNFCSKHSLIPLELIAYDREFIRLGFRGIARDTDERTAIFSLLHQACGVGNSMFVNVPKTYQIMEKSVGIQSIEIEKILFALGVFNSLVVDFVVRSMVQINFNKIYLERIPFPQPTAEEIRSNPLYTTITRNSLALQRYNDKSGHFASLDPLFGSKEWVQVSKHQGSYGLGGEPLSIPRTEKSYLTLKATNDILIAKLYGLDKEELIALLSIFKVLSTKQPHYIELLKSLWEDVEIKS
ncbi:Eco57I restriction-modification methylase domain-containing protein [Helicobacter pametensis]|uniref:Eco57I restriction-modification methylase domain-containing protein n=1 Tax=Helicobacter pametensis TaxID=95149 RepID=UPI000481FF8F|nr:N-6 DNA methylase [Helicobacter pametensis]